MQNGMTRRDVLRMGMLGATAGSLGLGWTGQAHAALPGPLRAYIFCHSVGKREHIARFKEDYKVDVEVTCWVSNATSLTRMSTGAGKGFDVFNINAQYVPPLLKQKTVLPIDYSKIPNTQYMFPMFQKPAWSTADGKIYSLPFMIGYDSVLYNAEKVEHVDSYGALFDEKYKGRISLRDDPQLSIAMAALYLGYTKPFELTSADLKKVRDFLIKKKPLFRKLWTGYGEVISLMKSGEAWIVGDGWLSMHAALLKDGMKVKLARPKERGLIWTHDWLIPKGADERGMLPTIYAFMDWTLGKEMGGTMSREGNYISPSKRAVEFLTPEEAKAIGYTDFMTLWNESLPMNVFPENLQEWNDTWSQFKAA